MLFRSRALVNNIYNLSIDQRFGKNNEWAIGANVMRTGGNNFILTGSYYGLSFARNFTLNKIADSANSSKDHFNKKHNLRVGLNVSYCYGSVDESNGGYSILIDVGGFKYNKNPNLINYTANATDYYNMSLGLLYQLKFEDVAFETGLAVNNILKPNFSIMNDSKVNKRLRISSNMSLSLRYNDNNMIRFEQFLWKEGLYIEGPKPETDSADISDMIYGVNWLNHKKLPIQTGIYMRSSKSIFFVSGVRISNSLTGKLSYELSTNSAYYPVNQFGLSLNYILNSDKKKNFKVNSTFF